MKGVGGVMIGRTSSARRDTLKRSKRLASWKKVLAVSTVHGIDTNCFEPRPTEVDRQHTTWQQER
jgi:hypothetical protein